MQGHGGILPGWGRAGNSASHPSCRPRLFSKSARPKTLPFGLLPGAEVVEWPEEELVLPQRRIPAEPP